MPIDRPARRPVSPARAQAQYERALQRDAERVKKNAQTTGVPLDAQNAQGWSKLHYAVNDGRVDLVRVLLRAGADANAPIGETEWPFPPSSTSGDRPVHRALSINDAAVMRALIDHGADVQLTNAQGQDLAAFAATCDPGLHALAHAAQVWFEERALRSTLDGASTPNVSPESASPRRRL